ncbi:MAG: DegT/DnrJ/EryC1/StrS family aminotransferase, partial [Oscillospiraceae bacterium]|nr:DegT/DnrJ/EryC1/StrS family aminotransferase [Oscillospiraceae bacterium]
MEFRNLKKQYEVLKAEIDSGITEVCTNANFISGAKVRQLEKELAEYVGVKHCVTCANGTDALTLALMVLGVGEGDCVFVPDFTFFSTAETVAYEGATPIFIDVDPDTFNMNPDSLKKAVEYIKNEGKLNAKAVITVDLFGLPADYDAITEIAEEYNLFIIEDSAQGFGGNIRGRMACSFAHIATTSFFPAKPLGCYGDGGAVFTDNDDYAALLRSYTVHGKNADDKYDNIRIGMNSRLDTIQAAVLLPKLHAFADYELDDVNAAAEYYTENLKGIVKTPQVPEGY